MDENTKQIVEEIKTSVVEQVSSDVVEKTFNKVKEELALRKNVFDGGDKEDSTKVEQKEAEMKDLQDMVKSMRKKDFAAAKDISQKYATKTLSEGVAADGGYVVPTVLSDEIIQSQAKFGVARRDALRLPVSTNKLTLTSVGDVIAYRTNEGAKKQASQPTFAPVNITIKKIAAIIPLTDELINDSPITLVTLMGQLGAKATAKVEDTWAFKGISAGEGLFQNGSINVYTLPTGSDTYAEAVPADLLAGLGLMSEEYLDGAKWYMSFSAYISLLGKNDTTGRPLIAAPNAGLPATMFGFPIEFVGVMPKTTDGSQPGTKFLAFGNLKALVLADRQQFTIDTSNEATITDTDGTTTVNLWQEDKTAIRIVERIDFQVADPSAFVVYKTAAS